MVQHDVALSMCSAFHLSEMKREGKDLELQEHEAERVSALRANEKQQVINWCLNCFKQADGDYIHTKLAKFENMSSLCFGRPFELSWQESEHLKKYALLKGIGETHLKTCVKSDM